MPAIVRQRIAYVLEDLLAAGPFDHAVVCTEAGSIVVGDAGDFQDRLPNLVSVVDCILTNAQGNIGLDALDEVTLLDREQERIIVRRVAARAESVYLIVKAPAERSWRRTTRQAVRSLAPLVLRLSQMHGRDAVDPFPRGNRQKPGGGT